MVMQLQYTLPDYKLWQKVKVLPCITPDIHIYYQIVILMLCCSNYLGCTLSAENINAWDESNFLTHAGNVQCHEPMETFGILVS